MIYGLWDPEPPEEPPEPAPPPDWYGEESDWLYQQIVDRRYEDEFI